MAEDLPEAYSPLTQQAEGILDENTTAVELVSKLDVGRYRYRDSSPEWADSAPFEPMFKAILLRELNDYSDRELRLKLEETEVAAKLGFDPEAVPSRSVFNRAGNHRFEAAISDIVESSRQIREIAAERGSPIGSTLVPEESENTSERSERREIRKRTREVLKEWESVIMPVLDLPPADGSPYDEEELLMVEALTGLLDDVGLNGAGDIYGDILDSEGELGGDDSYTEDGPTGETVIEPMKELSPTHISGMVNHGVRKCFTRVKPYDQFSGSVMLAIDITYVAYYGDRDEMVRVQGTPQNRDKKYDWCHKFATANIVGDNTHFVVAMLPVGDPEHYDASAYPGSDKSHRPGAVVRDLLEVVNDFLSVRVVYADREFFAAESFAACEDHGVQYVIPSPDFGRVNTDVDQVTVKQEHGLYGPVKGGVTNERQETTIVVLPPDDEFEDGQVFATNLEVKDEEREDRILTRLRIERYDNRAGIETAYSKIKEFGGMTTSRSYSVRLYHFGIGVLLYDLWLLVDFLVQVSMEGTFRSKPRVTSERFRKFLERYLHELSPG